MDLYPNVVLNKFPEIDEMDRALFVSAFEHFFRKVSVETDEIKLTLSLKDYKKGGLRSQHEVHGSLRVGGKSFFAEETSWQLLETVQSVLKKLEKEVRKQHSKKL